MRRLLIAGSMVLCLIAQISSAQDRWIAPTNGWELEYLASDGLLPENASPSWVMSNYKAGTVSLITDEFTSEDVLHLIMTNTASPYTYANYRLEDGNGATSHIYA